MRYTRLTNQSPDYLAAREELRLAEIDLMRQRERVAALRRGLPQGAEVKNYVFQEGPAALSSGDSPVSNVSLGDLFTNPQQPLVIYQLMYGKEQTSPCPMCTLWIDGFNGVVRHLSQNVNFAIAAAADPAALRAHARNRGWGNLRLLSCGTSSFKFDMGSEDERGNQDSTISVFTRDSQGTIRHTYSARPTMAEDIDQRGIDLLSPVWHVLDLTPQGRGDWYGALTYP
jgi:predicted dithiol-disulfide oxidoreductase (DUF899 family)